MSKRIPREGGEGLISRQSEIKKLVEASPAHLETLRYQAAYELGRLIIDTSLREKLRHPHRYWRYKRTQVGAAREFTVAIGIAEEYLDSQQISQTVTEPALEQAPQPSPELLTHEPQSFDLLPLPPADDQ